MGCRIFHYPTRGLEVAWDVREGRIAHVALGPSGWSEPRLGAPDLLRELLCVMPLLGSIGPGVPFAGVPRVRVHRVEALARARVGVACPGHGR